MNLSSLLLVLFFTFSCKKNPDPVPVAPPEPVEDAFAMQEATRRGLNCIIC